MWLPLSINRRASAAAMHQRRAAGRDVATLEDIGPDGEEGLGDGGGDERKRNCSGWTHYFGHYPLYNKRWQLSFQEQKAQKSNLNQLTHAAVPTVVPQAKNQPSAPRPRRPPMLEVYCGATRQKAPCELRQAPNTSPAIHGRPPPAAAVQVAGDQHHHRPRNPARKPRSEPIY